MFNAPEIFIDTSYVAYFNIFATWKWYTREYIYDDDDYRLDGTFDPITDKEFECMLEYKFRSSINDVIFSLINSVDKSKVYFACDCIKRDIWRNEYYDLYKRQRYDKKQPFNLSGSFSFLMNRLIPIECENNKHKMISVKNAEADDIIGHIVINNKKENFIITNDRDLAQLDKYAKIYNLLKDNINIKNVYKKEKVDDIIKNNNTGDFILYKALKGDNSDNITGFLPRTGPKTASKYISNKSLLKDICNKNKEAYDALKRNIKIMDLTKIPDCIKKDIWNEWENCQQGDSD